ncbi:MAG: GH92 family glycosyl hydrolase [Ginsengibacter sp.]
MKYKVSFSKEYIQKSRTTILFILLCKFSFSQDLVQYVQPMSGTAPSTTLSALKHSEGSSEGNANTIPSVCLPFAMTQWTPQTRQSENKCIPPYFYRDSLLTGFRGTHWLSGSCTQDYGSFTIMPVIGKLRTTARDYAISFSHEKEFSTPNYYKLTTEKMMVEMTATERCGVMQFTMLHDDSLYLLIMPNSDQSEGFVKTDAASGVVWGYNPVHRIYQGWGEKAGFNGWFYIKIDKQIARSGTFSADTIYGADSIQNKKDIGAFVGFHLKQGDKIVVKIGTSFSSLNGAKQNLQAEAVNKDFYEIETSATKTWERALSQIDVYTNNEKDKKIFYTAMYHAMQLPRLYNDVDGTYPKFAGNYELMNSGKRNYYDDFSMWDIYRAQLPLLELLQPEKINDFVQSLVWKGQQGGWLPIFPCWNNYTSAMIGDHATAFIASAYTKGIRDYNVKEAYRLMYKNAFTTASEKDYKNGMGRRALPSWLKYNFIPLEDSVPVAFHKKEQVSRTLEYAYDDYALSVIAKDLTKKNDEQKLFQRSLNYKNVFDKQVGSVRGRYENGNWYQPFQPDKREFFITEGTPRQYTFYVPQDVPGLVTIMGDRSKLEKALNTLFDKDEYWHGNEPGHQIPFMYNYTGAPWKTQRAVRSILNDEYSDGPGGLSGNDDAGQMSAWYIFASMGFYPLDPVSGNYLLSSTIFDSVKIRLPEGKIFSIITHKKNPGDQYISQVKWNGKIFNKNYLEHNVIKQGGNLELWLQDMPSAWGSKITQQPAGLKK